MPTFTTVDNDVPDIDTETLKVRLTGEGPDPGPEEKPDDVTDGAVVKNDGVPTDDADEAEQEKESNDPEDESFNPESVIFVPASVSDTPSADSDAVKKKRDFFFIFSIAAAAILLLAFLTYFTGFFAKKDNLKITPSQLVTAYLGTKGYSAISSYGFSLPGINPQPSSSDPTLSSFAVTLDNNLSYRLQLEGIVDSKSKIIGQLYIALSINGTDVFSRDPELFSPLVPYLQILYPNMSTEKAKTTLSELFTAAGTERTEGAFKLKIASQEVDGVSTIVLALTGKEGILMI